MDVQFNSLKQEKDHIGVIFCDQNCKLIGFGKKLDQLSKKYISIIGMPGCARSKKENGVDWILWRELCDLKISSDDINHMGNGGLL